MQDYSCKIDTFFRLNYSAVFKYVMIERFFMNTPFAEIVRPHSIEQVVGQSHIIGKNKLINRLIEQKQMINLIFYGPPGTGKTTVAEILAKNSDLSYYKLNATYSKTQDIRDIAENINTFSGINGILIYIDEIQNFNKKQQQLLLEYIEKGQIILIASTTENPYHQIYKSLLSRCTVIEFFSLDDRAIREGIHHALKNLQNNGYTIQYEDSVLNMLVVFSSGDLRKGLNTLGTMVQLYSENNELSITKELIETVATSKALLYDKNSDEHYDLLSALQKSIRGSDVNAALHYLARLLESGDIISPSRRLLVMASEDIGMAYPQAISIVKSCIDSAFYLGLPEARLPLAQATILLATSPKSNSGIVAIDSAISDLKTVSTYDIPLHLKDSHYVGAEHLNRGIGYLYPHDFENSYVKQQYLPDTLKDIVYYHPKNNKMENMIQEHFKKILPKK